MRRDHTPPTRPGAARKVGVEPDGLAARTPGRRPQRRNTNEGGPRRGSQADEGDHARPFPLIYGDAGGGSASRYPLEVVTITSSHSSDQHIKSKDSFTRR